MKTSFVKKFSRTALVAALGCTLPALAGPDNVGLGSAGQPNDPKRDVVVLNDPNTPINSYAAVRGPLSARAPTIDIQEDKANAGSFNPGDLVLVLQTTGNDAQRTTETGGEPQVGTWEFARIKAKEQKRNAQNETWTTLTLEEPLEHAYADGSTQLIRVPEYTSVVVGTTLSPKEWNGRTGGVLAMLVNGTLTINTGASINATGKGFRGGDTDPNTAVLQLCPTAGGSSNAQRGWGIAGGEVSTGTGNQANGGGGGMCVRSSTSKPGTFNEFRGGGGGGGNAGAGGNGGNGGSGGVSQQNSGGAGGNALNYRPKDSTTPGDRLLMGGGGGAGKADNALLRSGGNGGGIVFVRAAKLEAAGRIEADGENGKGTNNKTGNGSGSGAGAGGTIYLRIAGAANCGGGVMAGGGIGGNADGESGPGGGGAGGWLFFQKEKNSGSCELTREAVPGRGPGNNGTGIRDADRGDYGTLTDLTDKLSGGFLVLPRPVVATPANGSRTRENLPLYTGSLAETLTGDVAGSRVQVFVDGNPVGETTLSATGRWSLPRSLSDRPLSDDQHEVEAVVIHKNQGVQSLKSVKNTFTVDTLAPKVTVTAPAQGSRTRNTRPEYTGTVEDNGPGPWTVKLRVGNEEVDATVNHDTRTWSYQPPEELTSDTYEVTATATDAVGNPSHTASRSFTVDRAPEVTVTSPVQGSGTSNLQPTYTGTVWDDGPRPWTVKVLVDEQQEVGATVNADGTWSYESPVVLSPGRHTVRATVTDAMGSTTTDPVEFTVAERNLVGGGVGCAASGGAPSGLAMMGLALLSTLRARRRQK